MVFSYLASSYNLNIRIGIIDQAQAGATVATVPAPELERQAIAPDLIPEPCPTHREQKKQR
jgi:hypothetical protein